MNAEPGADALRYFKMAILDQRVSDPHEIMMSARSLQAFVNSFEDIVDPTPDALLFQGQFIAGPVLLSLAMELALKAWWATENQNLDIPKTHDLVKLFDELNERTRAVLEEAHPEFPSPFRGSPPIRRGLRSLLVCSKDAFVEWRYLHEMTRARFQNGEFNEALSAVIEEFDRTAG